MDKIRKALEEKKEIAFDVTNPRKSYAGHTVYRLQLKIYESHKEHPGYEFLGWKRFNDFKRLYKELKADFPNHFKQSFPDFAKGHFFGRFDEAVIEERRQSSLKLLQFIILYSQMLCHKSFQSFIENGVSQITPYLNQAASIANSSADLPVETAEIVNVDNNAVVHDNENHSLTPVNPTGEEDTVSDPLNNCFLESYDDTNSEGEEDNVFVSIQSDDGRQSWLQEARSICGDDIESLASEAADEFPVTPRESISDEASVLLGEPLNDNYSSPKLEDIPECENGLSCSPATAQGFDDNQNNTDISSPTLSAQVLHKKFQVDEKMSKIIEKTVEEDDYVFQASVAMSNAIEQEELGNIESAFDMYKFGIGLLLRGVQSDENFERRDAVRRKTAQYLLRAEELYKSNLKANEDKQMIDGVNPFCEDNKWRFRLSDVKVFGVVDKVMLIQKVFSDEVYVMKVLHKQGGEYKRFTPPKKSNNKQPRNLYNCKFMVNLLNCVEKPTGVYLLLEYISGGKLWDYLAMPLFSTHNQRYSSCIESHHSWNATDCDNSLIENSSNHEYTDIVDIPCNNYTKQGTSELCQQNSSTALTCKIKKSTSRELLMTEDDMRLWIAQIAHGIMELHSKGVMCRDLNPRNILIDPQGNIKLTYFSNVEGIDYTLDPDAVSNMYTSPEVNGVFEPDNSTDWWSFGAIIFELLTGESLCSCHPDGINNRSIITLPRRVSNEACSLLAGLLKYDPKERLGSGPSGSEEIKSHPFFSGINWNKLKS